ncbi:MAG TPA: hypothetical protein VFQ84_01760 [Arenimonas sp.]|uniref:hypothetical protein n=1 Tax=Arenimonas sp. TaxID=1872635 RepID=UPI002D7E1C39|nr:hypothetical protein [Arenimonas sp.]HEU0152049.1 hypothetical protein [Arenimonas sp.]
MIRTALILSALVAAPAFAADSVATLSAQQGTVLVNQGDEFITATDAQALLAGDRVMVMEGGSAEITFADGCVLPLVSGSLVDVPATSTCAGAVASVQNIGPSYAQAVGSRSTDRSKYEPLVYGFWGLVIVGMMQDGGVKFTYQEPAASP